MNVRYRVRLSPEEKEMLQVLVHGGSAGGVRHVKRAQVLLAAHAGKTDESIAALVQTDPSTVYRLKRRFVEGGLTHALHDRPRPGAPRKLSGKEEALLVATACSQAPGGRARWTLQLLADAMVRLTEHTGLSRETVRRRLAEKELKPWQKRMWCIPKVDAPFVACMEDILELYAAPPDARFPLVCFDETPHHLVAEVREPLPAIPGKPARYDYEYSRAGQANLFVMLAPLLGWRHVVVTERKTACDFAQRMRELVDVHFPDAERILVVLDNLSTHAPSALYEAFAPAEARRLLQRLEFHYTPRHASWLNMVEVEISVLTRQCLDRRIGDTQRLKREVARWEKRRNKERARVRWLFTLEAAREKLGRAYPHAQAAAAPKAAAA